MGWLEVVTTAEAKSAVGKMGVVAEVGWVEVTEPSVVDWVVLVRMVMVGWK